MEHLKQSFSVKFEYNIFFTAGLFSINNLMLSEFFKSQPSAAMRKILFVVDDGVVKNHPLLLNAIKQYFNAYTDIELVQQVIIIPGGEQAKNDPQLFDQLIEAIDKHGIDRHSYLAAIGGGAVLDLAGYAAAVAHRGIKHIRIPTTVLSQNDSGVGVKNGINFKGKKNFTGTFAPPAAVFNDQQFLLSLTDRDYRSGISEAVKVALIKDLEFFEWIETHAIALSERDLKSMDYLIKRCAALHLNHISGDDPFESGSSRPLDFGHWAAHKLEQLSSFSITHGEAVAMGIALDSTYSHLAGLLSADKLYRILNLLGVFFTITHPLIQIQDLESPILKGLTEFQEHLGGKLTITLLSGLGNGHEVNHMNYALLIAASNYVLAFSEKPTIFMPH